MNITQIIQQLRQERERIDRAISALQELERGTTRRGPGRPAGSARAAATRGPRFMSPEARARISEAMRQRWAERKKKD